jgi:transposase InsO family protein
VAKIARDLDVSAEKLRKWVNPRIYMHSRQTYGATRIHFELRTLGVRCARKRVARLLREAGLFGCGGRRRRRLCAHRPSAALGHLSPSGYEEVRLRGSTVA